MTESIHAESLVIRRTLPAAPEVVWSMWTDPDHSRGLVRRPAGATVEVISLEVRGRGLRHASITALLRSRKKSTSVSVVNTGCELRLDALPGTTS